MNNLIEHSHEELLDGKITKNRNKANKKIKAFLYLKIMK